MSSSETRPVPRRESPWGMPEGDHRQPKAHRCNDRAEDVIQEILLRRFQSLSSSSGSALRSKPGEEPTEPYTCLELDPPKRDVKLE